MPAPLQTNAADPSQVRHAARIEKKRTARQLAALKAVMATPEGRMVMWNLLERAGIYRSIWHPSAQIHYNSGRQDFGHELLAMLTDADEEAYLTMEREMRTLARRESNESEAVRTNGANDGE
jgi:hypothetical protein